MTRFQIIPKLPAGALSCGKDYARLGRQVFAFARTSAKPMLPVAPSFLYLALRPLPLTPLQPFLTVLLDAVVWRHPRIFERLGTHSAKRFGLDPTDLPFAFILDPQAGEARISAVRQLPDEGLEARITGPFSALVGLANGSFDGDALFFSRAITIEGDVEAIVALRNAMDDAGVNLVEDATAYLGPFAAPLDLAIRVITAFGGASAIDVGGRKWN